MHHLVCSKDETTNYQVQLKIQRFMRNIRDIVMKPRPHQQKCRGNTVECHKVEFFYDKVERCFDIVAGVDGA